jgi:hypothetical protein
MHWPVMYSQYCTCTPFINFQNCQTTQKEIPYPLGNHSYFPPLPQPLATANPISVYMNLLILGISYKWNDKICDLLYLIPFT